MTSSLCRIRRQVVESLKYMHDMGVVHCDVKLENIMLRSPGELEAIKLIGTYGALFVINFLTFVCLYDFSWCDSNTLPPASSFESPLGGQYVLRIQIIIH